MKAIDLKTEGRTTPLGIDEKSPVYTPQAVAYNLAEQTPLPTSNSFLYRSAGSRSALSVSIPQIQSAFGVVYDARKIPGYSHAAQRTDYPVIPTASPAGPILEQERFKAELLTAPSGAKILDFGQNLAGYVRFTLNGTTGQQIRLRLRRQIKIIIFCRKDIP